MLPSKERLKVGFHCALQRAEIAFDNVVEIFRFTRGDDHVNGHAVVIEIIVANVFDAPADFFGKYRAASLDDDANGVVSLDAADQVDVSRGGDNRNIHVQDRNGDEYPVLFLSWEGVLKWLCHDVLHLGLAMTDAVREKARFDRTVGLERLLHEPTAFDLTAKTLQCDRLAVAIQGGA